MSKGLEISEAKFVRITYGVLAASASTALLLAATAAVWATSLDIKTEETANVVGRLQEIYGRQYERVGEAVVNIDKRLSRIEGLLEAKQAKGE